MNPQLIFDTADLLKILCEKEPYDYVERKGAFNVKRIVKGYKGRKTNLNLSKKIVIQPSALGLIVGEGHLGDRTFVFCNSEESIITCILSFMRQFDVKPTLQLEVCTKNIDDNFITRAKETWETLLKSEINNIRLRSEFNNTTEKGNIHLRYNNVCLGKILRILVKLAKYKVEQDHASAMDYVKGLLAAEGNVNVKKSTGCLYMVRISAKLKSQRSHYKRCLEKAGFKLSCKDMPSVSAIDGLKAGWKTTHGRAGCVILSRWENFVKLLVNDAFELCPRKKEFFLRGFAKTLFTKQFMQLGKWSSDNFTFTDVKRELNLRTKPIQRMTRLVEAGYIAQDRSQFPYQHKLTQKYTKLYDKLIRELPTFQLQP